MIRVDPAGKTVPVGQSRKGLPAASQVVVPAGSVQGGCVPSAAATWNWLKCKTRAEIRWLPRSMVDGSATHACAVSLQW